MSEETEVERLLRLIPDEALQIELRKALERRAPVKTIEVEVPDKRGPIYEANIRFPHLPAIGFNMQIQVHDVQGELVRSEDAVVRSRMLSPEAHYLTCVVKFWVLSADGRVLARELQTQQRAHFGQWLEYPEHFQREVIERLTRDAVSEGLFATLRELTMFSTPNLEQQRGMLFNFTWQH